MGVRTDVFIATPDQITDEVFALGPNGRFPAVEGRGLMPDAFEKLLQIVEPSRGPEFAALNRCKVIRNGEETSVFSVPDSVVKSVAGAGADRLREIELAWLYKGKPPASSPLDGIVKDWWGEFVDLLKDAHSQGLNFYVWLSA